MYISIYVLCSYKLCLFVKLVIHHPGRALYLVKENKLKYHGSFSMYLRHLKLHVLSRLWTFFSECAIGLCLSPNIVYSHHMIHIYQLKSISCCLRLLGPCIINWPLPFIRRVNTVKVNFTDLKGSISNDVNVTQQSDSQGSEPVGDVADEDSILMKATLLEN